MCERIRSGDVKHIILAGVSILGAEAASGQQPEQALAPLLDHRQHLLSPLLAPALSSEPITAEALIAQLDAAGIRRALVLSLAYMQGSPRIRGADEYAKVRVENDWTATQVRKYPDRILTQYSGHVAYKLRNLEQSWRNSRSQATIEAQREAK